jgi:hypothetical protein
MLLTTTATTKMTAVTSTACAMSTLSLAGLSPCLRVSLTMWQANANAKTGPNITTRTS